MSENETETSEQTITREGNTVALTNGPVTEFFGLRTLRPLTFGISFLNQKTTEIKSLLKTRKSLEIKKSLTGEGLLRYGSLEIIGNPGSRSDKLYVEIAVLDKNYLSSVRDDPNWAGNEDEIPKVIISSNETDKETTWSMNVVVCKELFDELERTVTSPVQNHISLDISLTNTFVKYLNFLDPEDVDNETISHYENRDFPWLIGQVVNVSIDYKELIGRSPLTKASALPSPNHKSSVLIDPVKIKKDQVAITSRLTWIIVILVVMMIIFIMKR